MREEFGSAQPRLQDFPSLPENPRRVILDVLRVRTYLFPEARGMTLEDIEEATGFQEVTIRRELTYLSVWGEVYNPMRNTWVAVDLD